MNEKIDEAILKNAQYRKSLAIAYFNATNAAIELCKNLNLTKDVMKKSIVYFRDWFLEEHKTYYAQNIANIGKPYDTKATIAKAKQAKTLDELIAVWKNYSEDERSDGDVIKAVQELKKQLTK